MQAESMLMGPFRHRHAAQHHKDVGVKCPCRDEVLVPYLADEASSKNNILLTSAGKEGSRHEPLQRVAGQQHNCWGAILRVMWCWSVSNWLKTVGIFIGKLKADVFGVQGHALL